MLCLLKYIQSGKLLKIWLAGLYGGGGGGWDQNQNPTQ